MRNGTHPLGRNDAENRDSGRLSEYIDRLWFGLRRERMRPKNEYRAMPVFFRYPLVLKYGLNLCYTISVEL